MKYQRFKKRFKNFIDKFKYNRKVRKEAVEKYLNENNNK